MATLAGVACIRQQEGCILCVARHTPAEVEERLRRLCNPKKTTECTEFCTTLAAECATPWRSGPNCLAQSEDEFRRQQFWLEAADRPSAELVGRVLDAESKKLDGARVELADGPTVVAEATTGKDGGFRIPLRVGSYTMRVSRSGYATQLETVRLLADKAPPFHVLRMSPEERISGHVLDGSGAPVAGVTVLAVRVTADPLSVAEAQTGADGAFTLRGLDAHRYALRVLAFGYRAVETPRVQAPATRVLWHLERTHIVRGLVTTTDGTPQAQAKILILATGGGAESPVSAWTSGADGRYAIDGLSPGSYLMWAQKNDRATYPPMRVTLEAEDLEPLDVGLTIDHEGALVTGYVVDPDGRPLGGLHVDLSPRWPLALPIALGAETGRDGKFSVDGLTPGRYEILVRQGPRPLPLLEGPRDVEVPIEEGEEVDLDGKVKVRPKLD